MAKKEKESLVLEEERVEDLKSKADKKGNTYQAEGEEKEVLHRVIRRFNDMRDSQSRQDAEDQWKEAEKEYEAYTETKADDDTRTDINKPIDFSIVETELQETSERKARPKVDSRSVSDDAKMSMIDDVMDYSFDVGNFEYQNHLLKKESLIYGTAIGFEYYRFDKRTLKDLEVKREGGEIVEEYKTREKVDFDDPYFEYVHIRNIYLDNAANHISKCRDAIWREILDIDEFRRKYSQKRGFENIEYVIFGGDTFIEGHWDRPVDIGDREVEIRHYYNRAIDRYDVVANGVVIRKGPLPFPHKELPFVVYYCYKLPNKLYGWGVPKIIKSLKEERNQISNLRIDYQKQAIHKMYFYDDMLELDEMDLVARPHGGVPVNTQGQPIQNKVMWMEYGDVKPSSYEEENVLIEDIRRTTGIDDRLQGVNMGSTATEASILKEAAMKRINAKMVLLENDALLRLARLRYKNIAKFYPIPKMEKIVDDEGKEKYKKKYREIKIQGKKYTIDQEGNLVLEKTGHIESLKIDKKLAKFLDDELDFEIRIDNTAHVSKPLRQSKVTEMLNTLAANPALLATVDPRAVVERYIRVFEEDPSSWGLKEYQSPEEMKTQAEMENRMMLAGYPLPPTPNATEDHTQIHLNKTESREFEESTQEVQDAFQTHIEGEASKLGTPTPNQGTPPGSPEQQTDVMPNAGGSPMGGV